MAEDLTRNQSTEAPLPAPGPAGAPPVVRVPGPTVAIEPAEEPQPEDLLAGPPRDWEPAPHTGRFLLAYGVLGLIVGAAIITFAVLTFDRGGGTASRAWSTWQPSGGDGSERVRNIAQHISAAYRLPSGRQMVAALPRSPDSMPTPVTTAVIDEQALFREEQGYTPYELDDGMLYFLCGFGANCSISEGEPSMERQQLLRRQALELALYTFRYMKGVDPVVVALPPRPDAAAQAEGTEAETPLYALLFRKAEYEAQLDKPLRETLPSPTLPADGQLRGRESATVDDLTLDKMFRYQLQPSSDGQTAILLLTPALDSA